ncbi:uncharacterized protein PHACADRAFT_76342, partial [Phanerochaete carnosa HHB-10118-sp]
EDDEDIICFDGAEAYAAFHCHKQSIQELNLGVKTNIFTAYKKVDRKVRPVPGVFPEEAKVTRNFPEDPLDSLVPLPTTPPEFIPNGRLTKERLEEINFNADKFLWPEEEKLFTHILQ